METQTPSLAAKIAVFAFGLFSLIGGWIVVNLGGFFHTMGKYQNKNVIFVEGPQAAVMAVLQFTAAALAFMWLFRLRLAPVPAFLLAFGLVLLPPALYLSLR